MRKLELRENHLRYLLLQIRISIIIENLSVENTFVTHLITNKNINSVILGIRNRSNPDEQCF